MTFFSLPTSLMFLAVLVLSTLHSPTSASSGSQHVTTVTGRQLPSQLVRSRIPHVHHLRLHHHIFELVPKANCLVSSNHTIDLNLLDTVNSLPSLTGSTHIVNGVSLPPFVPTTIVKSGSGLLAIFYASDQQPQHLLHLSAHGIDLSPLHPKFPGIFVAADTIKSSSREHVAIEDIQMRSVLSKFTPKSVPTKAAALVTPVPKPLGQCANGVPHYLEVGVAFDNTLCAFYDNDYAKTISMIHALFAAASRPFLLDTCIHIALVHVDGHCKDPEDPYAPFKESISFFILFDFMKMWQTPQRQAVPRDVMFLITGFEDGTTTSGGALFGDIGGVCNPSSGFGWVEGILPTVFAHELAHTLNARHGPDGLMRSFYEPDMPIPRLSNASINSIISFVDDNPLAACITTKEPKLALAPIPKAVPSPKVFPEYGTCAVSRPNAPVLDCSPNHVIGRLWSAGVGTLFVSAFQEFGRFVTVVRSRAPSVMIEEFRGLQHMNGTLPEHLFSFEDDFKPKRKVVLIRRDVAVRWPRPRPTCCGYPLYIYVNVKWCRTPQTANGKKRCVTKFRRFKRKVSCQSPCHGHSEGRVVPMSRNQRCPTCRD